MLRGAEPPRGLGWDCCASYFDFVLFPLRCQGSGAKTLRQVRERMPASCIWGAPRIRGLIRGPVLAVLIHCKDYNN